MKQRKLRVKLRNLEVQSKVLEERPRSYLVQLKNGDVIIRKKKQVASRQSKFIGTLVDPSAVQELLPENQVYNGIDPMFLEGIRINDKSTSTN